MRGIYGPQLTIQCPICQEDFTRTQPGKKYCDVLCYEQAARKRFRDNYRRAKEREAVAYH